MLVERVTRTSGEYQGSSTVWQITIKNEKISRQISIITFLCFISPATLPHGRRIGAQCRPSPRRVAGAHAVFRRAVKFLFHGIRQRNRRNRLHQGPVPVYGPLIDAVAGGVVHRVPGEGNSAVLQRLGLNLRRFQLHRHNMVGVIIQPAQQSGQQSPAQRALGRALLDLPHSNRPSRKIAAYRPIARIASGFVKSLDILYLEL